MKKMTLLMVALLIAVFAVFAMGSGESTSTTKDQGSGVAAGSENNNDPNVLGDYKVEIESCRLAKAYDDAPVVIVKYIYTNVSDDDATSFTLAVNDEVFQNGVGLNKAYLLDDSANYSSDNQSKEIKKGASIEVEVAYALNDTTSDIEVEVSELISLNDTTITKTFSIS